MPLLAFLITSHKLFASKNHFENLLKKNGRMMTVSEMVTFASEYFDNINSMNYYTSGNIASDGSVDGSGPLLRMFLHRNQWKVLYPDNLPFHMSVYENMQMNQLIDNILRRIRKIIYSFRQITRRYTHMWHSLSLFQAKHRRIFGSVSLKVLHAPDWK